MKRVGLSVQVVAAECMDGRATWKLWDNRPIGLRTWVIIHPGVP